MTHDPMRQADIKRRLANMAKAPRSGARTRAGRPCGQADAWWAQGLGRASALDTRERRNGRGSPGADPGDKGPISNHGVAAAPIHGAEATRNRRAAPCDPERSGRASPDGYRVQFLWQGCWHDDRWNGAMSAFGPQQRTAF